MAEVQSPPPNLKLEAPDYGASAAAEQEGPVIELGDRIRLSGGKYDGTTGRVIYRTFDKLHLMPDGLTHSALEFNLTEDGFEEETGIEGVEILQKRKKPALVDILDLATGQLLETFDEEGNSAGMYKIKKVDSDLDNLVVEGEGGEEVDLRFGFRGIDESMPFRVIRGRQAPEKIAGEATGEATSEATGEATAENEGNESPESDEEEVEDFTFLDDELEETPAEEEVQRLVEIPTSERIYSNMRQKSEAYADLLSFNSDAMQKLETTQKSTRVLTEIFFQLRAAIMRVSEDGIPKGVKPTSIQTLIDLLETRSFELSRIVIDIDKIVYYDIDPDINPQPESMEGLRLQYFNKKIVDTVEYFESSTDMEGQKFTQFLNGYLSRFGASWRSRDSTGAKAFQRDEEAFRLKAPDAESSIPGYGANLPNKKEAYLSSELISEVSMSLVRGLKAIRSKGKLLEVGEEAAVLAYVVFPLVYATSLSMARQESLTADIQSALASSLSIAEILKRTGEITDIPSTNNAFLVSTEGGSLGNIPLREYIKATNLKLEGMGDIWPLQVLMGMREKEWTIDQYAAIQEKINETHEQMLDFILRQREALAKQAAQPPAVQGIQMTPDGPAMIQKLADEPILKDYQQNIKDQMPSFAASDVALVGLILRQHSDLAFAQLAEQPAALTRNRMKYAREEYLTTIRNTQLYKQRISFAGEPPEPVNCPHVKPLEMIRKVKDDKKRFALLAKFLTTFQGSKQDNWVNCRIGDHHLLCVHELLQVYQFLRPGDSSVLNKDIQLNFGGGQHMGSYICRVCGQPISELEYDTHLEFDDQGKPMMGRSELVDQDAVTQQEIDELIGPLGDLEEPVEFDNETKRLIFNTARQMADKIFAPLETSDYMTLVARAFGVLQQIPERERYIKIQKARTKGAKAAAAADFGADYDIYINQALVCAVGVHLLLIIQSKKPDFILRGIASGCRSLRGEPLEPDGGNHGIQCIASVIASFQKDSPPWSLTQFQREKDDTIRNRMVMDVFEPILKAALQDPTILQALAQKRDYKRKILGAAGGQGRPDEEIPPNFAPIPFVMKPEDFVEKIIIPEAASPKDRAELWVRQGNHLARTTKLPKPIAYSEASCCLSPINKIDEFWIKSASSLPPFKKLTGLPAPPKIMRFEPTMKPSVISRPLPDAPEKSYYLLFLKVCHEGEKKGYSHEFGLTHKCIWCDLKLPKEAELLTADQGRAAIESQGIDVSKESFEDLLNETHRVNSFRTKLLLEIPGQLDNWIKLTEMDPEPTEGFRAMMSRTQIELTKLPPDAKAVEVAVALSEFSTFVTDLEQQFKTRIAVAQHPIFDQILKDGSESIIRFLQSYVIVPLKQFISKRAAVATIPDSWELSWQHAMDVNALLKEHRSYLTKFNKVQATPWLEAKVDTVLVQTRATLDALMSLRPLQIPGGDQTFGFFMKMCLYAPLANFVDPNIQPLTSSGAEAPTSQVEQHALFPARFISDMAARFKVEGSHLTPEQIRELIAERNEKEKANIIKKMNDMSRAGKDIEKIKIKLGIGEYAVGGTKAIYAYDQERYDIEREERAQAGIIDFPGQGPDGTGGVGGAAGEQRPVDGLGYYETGEEGGYIGDEELGEINGFDDDN
jgi:hypothetical protein